MLQNRDKILAVSIELFKTKGYKGTTTKILAREAGVNELTIFRHFGTKEGILRAIIDDRFDYMQKTLESISHELAYDISEDFPKIFELYNKKFSDAIGLVLVFLNEDELDEETTKSFHRIPNLGKAFLTDYFTQVRKKRGKGIDPETAALMYMSMNFGVLVMKQKLFNEFSGTFVTQYPDMCIEVFTELLQ